MIKREWLRYYTKGELSERSHGSTIIQSWDTAAKDGANNDWSACTTWLVHDKVYYLLELTRGRYEYPEMRDVAIRLTEQYKPDVVLIEDTYTGTALAQELNHLVKGPIKPVPVHGKKSDVSSSSSAFPKDASFMPELEAEYSPSPTASTTIKSTPSPRR